MKLPHGLQERRRVTMPNGKWTTRGRTKQEVAELNAEGKHLQPDTDVNDQQHIHNLRYR